MPIKGLTDSNTRTASMFPTLGKLFKGGQKRKKTGKDGKTYEIMGEDLPYFRFEPEAAYPDVAESFRTCYGNTPVEFPCCIMGETVEEAFDPWLEAWDAAGTLLARSDGETIITKYNPQTLKWDNGEWPHDPKAYQWGRVGRLSLLMPELIEASGKLGVVRLDIHGVVEILRIHNYLTGIAALTGFAIKNIPFILGRADEEINAPMGDKRGKITKSLIYLHAQSDFMRGFMGKQLAAPAVKPMLAAPDVPQLDSGEEPELYYPEKLKVYEQNGIRWGQLEFEGGMFEEISVILTPLPADYDVLSAGETVSYHTPVTLEKHPTKKSLLATPYIA